jgi:hypothetical protein
VARAVTVVTVVAVMALVALVTGRVIRHGAISAPRSTGHESPGRAGLAVMATTPTRDQLEAAHCWEESDRAGTKAMTDFRRRLRYHQASWREAQGYPMGTLPIVPQAGKPARPVGSRVPLDFGRDTGANLITGRALAAATARAETVERHQSFDAQRLWADLLSPMALCFNLFGDLADDRSLADEAVHRWWPDTPGTVREVRFSHSPGRLDPAYLGNLASFDVAFVLDLDDGSHGILGLVTRYHERVQRRLPKPSRLEHYLRVTERSRAFEAGSTAAVNGTPLTEMWLDHLLVHSMLQHESGQWSWGRFVQVHPAGNLDFLDACNRYRQLLRDASTFASATIEELIGDGVLPETTTTRFRRRYLAD